MPNVKIYVEQAVMAEHGAAILAALPDLRAMLCAELAVDHAACQFAVMPVQGLMDQPLINIEMMILPRPDRTRDKITHVAQQMRAIFAPVGHAAIRIAQLDPASYVALK